MESDYRIPTAAGSAAWAIALVVLLSLGDGLPPQDRWWIWVCAVGLALGVFGFFYIPWLQRRQGGQPPESEATAGEAQPQEPAEKNR